MNQSLRGKISNRCRYYSIPQNVLRLYHPHPSRVSHFCHSRNFVGNPPLPSLYVKGGIKYCGPLIKPFRGDDLFFCHAWNSGGNPPPAVIPEIFNRESKFLLFPLCPSIGKDRACLAPLFPKFSRESKYFFKPWTPDRTIQGQAKNGLKIAGVTKKGNRSIQEWRTKATKPFRGDDLPTPSFPKSLIGNPSFCFFFGF